MKIEPIGYFHSPFTSKFGIPRQSGIVQDIRGRIVLAPKFSWPEGLRGLEDYDYVWLIWGFSEHTDAKKHPTVRPPLLGGNERIGVWATRSPFRPNNLGLSSVRIATIDTTVPYIEVFGADLMDGTPIYDIKPYLPYVDSHPEARGGFTDQRKWHRLQVEMTAEVANMLSPENVKLLTGILELDPRPHYHDDVERVYGLPFMGWEVRFRVNRNVLQVVDLVKK